MTAPSPSDVIFPLTSASIPSLAKTSRPTFCKLSRARIFIPEFSFCQYLRCEDFHRGGRHNRQRAGRSRGEAMGRGMPFPSKHLSGNRGVKQTTIIKGVGESHSPERPGCQEKIRAGGLCPPAREVPALLGRDRPLRERQNDTTLPQVSTTYFRVPLLLPCPSGRRSRGRSRRCGRSHLFLHRLRHLRGGFLLRSLLGRRLLRGDLLHARCGVALVTHEHLVTDADPLGLHLLASLQVDRVFLS